MLKNLPESFLLQLADIDPVVGMVSKKLHKSYGGSRIDAWKFVTSRARYELLISNVFCGSDNCRGIRDVMYAKAAFGDPEFMYVVSSRNYRQGILNSTVYAARNDLPRMIEYCLVDVSSWYICNMQSIILNVADKNGSTRVLTWFLENRPDIIKRGIPFMRGIASPTVKWFIDNLMESSPALVDWVMMKVEAIWHNKDRI